MAGNDFWQSMVNAAKNKTAEVVELVKNDINELSSTVNAEVLYYSDVVKREASNLLGNVKETFNRGSITFNGTNPVRSLRYLWSPETVHDDVSPMMIRDSEPIPMTEVQFRHHLLVTNPKNFTEGFYGDEETQADAWYVVAEEGLSDVEVLGKQLSECPALADMYRRLVPDQVSHSEFWKRYFFRRHLALDRYTEEDVEKEDEVRAHQDVSVSLDDDEHPATGNEFFAVEVESPYEPSSSGAKPNDWDIEIERIKETNDGSLHNVRVVSAD